MTTTNHVTASASPPATAAAATTGSDVTWRLPSNQVPTSPSPPSSRCQSMVSIREHVDEILGSKDGSTLVNEKRARVLCHQYQCLSTDDKTLFLAMLSRDYGVDHDSASHMAQALYKSKRENDVPLTVKVEERLRHALVPRYQQLFTLISRLDTGVKFLVDLRSDLLTAMSPAGGHPDPDTSPHLHALNSCLHELFSLWLSVGCLRLERITWESSCDLLQKVTQFEAVHPIRNWTDLKQRVGPYRRCYVFTHHSMPREPVVVLHAALSSEIAASIQSVVVRPRGAESSADSPAPDTADGAATSSGSNSMQEREDVTRVNTAIFYSITSTQKGLQGVELGNSLIRSVVHEMLSEMPHMTQFASLSPIPGFRDWLISEVNSLLHQRQGSESRALQGLQGLLKDEELTRIAASLNVEINGVLDPLRKVIISNAWAADENLASALRVPLMRLCAHYLYNEKRRGFAVNPVANFHLRNGATIWRLNWLADKTSRGLTASCGLMVNYRYHLDQTEDNSRMYVETQNIAVSDQFIELLKPERGSPRY